MSRAKYFNPNGEDIWFDYKARATAEQLELLADYEGLDIDDLLDESLGQKQVAQRLFEAAKVHVVPPEVLERRRERQRLQGAMPACRICTLNDWECDGRITRHHFMPRWLMLELENYPAYAARRLCTIPVCVGRHRDLHYRDESDKSIVKYLRTDERRFLHKMLGELQEQHPKIFELLLGGDYYAYEYQLVRDYTQGLFLRDEESYDLEEYDVPTGLSARCLAASK